MSTTVPVATIDFPAAPAPSPAEVLMVTAALLLEQPRQILNHTRLVATVLRAAGPQVSTVALRPVWETLPLDPDGDEHREYAARLILTAKSLRAVAA